MGYSGAVIALGGDVVYGRVLSFLASRLCFFCCITSLSCSNLHLVFEFSMAKVLAVSHFLQISPEMVLPVHDGHISGSSRLHWHSLTSHLHCFIFDVDGEWPSHLPYEQEAWLQPRHLFVSSDLFLHVCFWSFCKCQNIEINIVDYFLLSLPYIVFLVYCE